MPEEQRSARTDLAIASLDALLHRYLALQSITEHNETHAWLWNDENRRGGQLAHDAVRRSAKARSAERRSLWREQLPRPETIVGVTRQTVSEDAHVHVRPARQTEVAER